MTTNLMFNRWLNGRLRSLIVSGKCPMSVQAYVNLGFEMKALNDKKEFAKVLKLFDTYKQNDSNTYASMIITQALKACTQIGDFQRGATIHRLLSCRMKQDSYITTSLVHLYMQSGDVTLAQSLFDSSTNKTLSMYGAMMKGYITNNVADQAIHIFKQIRSPDQVIIILLFSACAQLGTHDALNTVKEVASNIPKLFHSNPRLTASLFDALIKCGDCSSAEILYSKMKKTVMSHGNLMHGFNQENRPDKTLYLFDQMKIYSLEPESIIYLGVLKALSQMGIFTISQTIVEQIPKSLLDNNQIQNALIDMWGKTGYVNKAKEIFGKISQPDRIGYTVMINSYGLNGMGIQAIELFHRMPSEFIDEVTHICVLNACSHSGLVDNARSIFGNIQMKTFKIYATMIDCLSRAALFEEAQQLVDEFECHHSPVWPMYMALLSGARNDKNSNLSQQIFDRMKKIFPELTSPLTSASVLLANVYASSGDIDKASTIRTQLYESGAKKKVGVSWTATNGQLFQFRAHDHSHPRSSEIYAELEKISKELVEHGHQYDSSWITRPLNQDETVASVLCGHSEKLAIAWNFVEHPNASLIQVAKNLRVCGDCHRATKLIASIRQCEIIVRDTNRIHHFHTNGQCSCQDSF